ncbi:hypothetical protein [Brevundimonas sp.]|uniref:hypothetical protein n=1 Tax=Brevundimonas sp. TaxID=1871086 RepID=UPI0035AF27CE
MSAGTLEKPIEVGTNEDLSERFVFFEDEAQTSPINLSGYSASFGLRKASRGAADLGATSVNQEVTVDLNAVVVLIPAERLADLTPGDYGFEVKVISPLGKRTVKLRGRVNILSGIAP